jgi:hypothetical protein
MPIPVTQIQSSAPETDISGLITRPRRYTVFQSGYSQVFASATLSQLPWGKATGE